MKVHGYGPGLKVRGKWILKDGKIMEYGEYQAGRKVQSAPLVRFRDKSLDVEVEKVTGRKDAEGRIRKEVRNEAGYFCPGMRR